jgi:hypothetical protein
MYDACHDPLSTSCALSGVGVLAQFLRRLSIPRGGALTPQTGIGRISYLRGKIHCKTARAGAATPRNPQRSP